jgi:hypothetical protein
MRLTITCDPRRRGLRVHVERALDYPPGHVPGLLAAATAEALTQPPPTADEVELPGLVPAPRTARDGQPRPAGLAPELVEARLRRRVLRALDEGATVTEAARTFGIDPAQIDRWDDDAAIDARTDLLGAGPGGQRPQRVAS